MLLARPCRESLSRCRPETEVNDQCYLEHAVLAWAAQYANMSAEQAHALPLAGTTGTTAGELGDFSMVRERDAATKVRVG